MTLYNRLAATVAEQPPPWYTLTHEVYRLCRWLVNEQGFELDNVMEVIEQPRKWQTEYDEMLSAEAGDTAVMESPFAVS